MCNTNPMVLIYQNSEGDRYIQHWQDLTEMGTLVDPETGDDMELIGWQSLQTDGLDALRDLLDQLEGVGIYIPGEDSGQWAGTEGLSFTQAEAAATLGTPEGESPSVPAAVEAKATPASIRSMALEAAEAFIEGLEGEEGIDDLLDLIRLAKRVRECEEAALFAIARQDEPVFWSNTQGWVDVISCDLFTSAEVERVWLPLEGRWVRIG